MPGAEEWIADGRYFGVTVFGDVSTRDGLGWELEDLAPAPGRGQVYEVFREDSGEVPVISSTCFQPADVGLVERFAKAAVLVLLGETLRNDQTDWHPTNIARALSLAGRRVSRWWGPEWPLTEHLDGTAGSYAAPGADAVPLAWLRLALDTQEIEIGTYQDGASFGLCVDQPSKAELSDHDPAYFRIHERLDLPTGSIESVSVVIDTTVLGDSHTDRVLTDALLAEVVLTVEGRPVPLVAAEAYGPDEWHRLDESVVVLSDVAAFDRIDWIPRRPQVPDLPGRSGGS